MPRKMQMYATKTDLARIFGVTRPTVYARVKGIEGEIGKRYGKYAIVGNLVSIAVYADYEKYRNLLSQKNHRKYVEPFDLIEAEQYIQNGGRLNEKEKNQMAQGKV